MWVRLGVNETNLLSGQTGDKFDDGGGVSKSVSTFWRLYPHVSKTASEISTPVPAFAKAGTVFQPVKQQKEKTVARHLFKIGKILPVGLQNDIHHLLSLSLCPDGFASNQRLDGQLAISLQGGFNGQFLGAQDAQQRGGDA
jgi:hypothetical protein